MSYLYTGKHISDLSDGSMFLTFTTSYLASLHCSFTNKVKHEINNAIIICAHAMSLDLCKYFILKYLDCLVSVL